ncbi:MAG: DNA-binding domain-containing protein [Breznakibacter sp.]
MASSKFSWKIWLRLNLLTKDVDNDYTAEVSTLGSTKRNEDIARLIVAEGSEIKYDTLLSILNQSDRIKRETLQAGSSVLDGVCHITPRVTGAWLGASAKFDSSVHKITVDMIPSAELREALKDVGIEVLGVKDSGAYIGLVTDTLTGATDGTVTPGEDILIEGDKLRVAPDDDATMGVFFIDASGTAVPVSRRLTQNDPKKLLARVPVLPAGEYTLQVRTRYSRNTTLLNESRLIDYPRKLAVK